MKKIEIVEFEGRYQACLTQNGLPFFRGAVASTEAGARTNLATELRISGRSSAERCRACADTIEDAMRAMEVG